MVDESPTVEPSVFLEERPPPIERTFELCFLVFFVADFPSSFHESPCEIGCSALFLFACFLVRFDLVWLWPIYDDHLAGKVRALRFILGFVNRRYNFSFCPEKHSTSQSVGLEAASFFTPREIPSRYFVWRLFLILLRFLCPLTAFS